VDLKAFAGEKLRLGALRRDGRAQLIGGSAVAVVVLAVVVTLLATSGGGSGGANKQRAARNLPKASIDVSPGDGADGVKPSGELKVTAGRGKLLSVEVRDDKGRKVSGTSGAGARSWRPDSHLATGTAYTVRATARNAEGRKTVRSSHFTTLKPDRPFVGIFTPEDKSTVGVGMPVSINFNHPVTDKKDVEKGISVKADPGVDVQGHWFGDSRLDFRPKDYWKAGTKVRLSLHLDGVEGSDGAYGTQDKSVGFTVGRRQVSVVDAEKKEMTVKRDGKKIRTIPITSGSDEHPTYNGKMVISERNKKVRMDGRTVGFGRNEDAGGYDIKDVPHAMRLSTSGTFIHGNYWVPQPQFGVVNASHGCVGLFDKKGGGDGSTPAAWFYSHSIIGDVVQIKNSHDKTVPPDNGLNGWNMDWDKWKAGH
jgi:lipoprotein-anchoring transpeptidase ErfK/SrfK